MSVPDTRWSVVLAAQGGDAEAIRELTERYRPSIVRFLAARGNLGDEAEDVAQEVFLALMHQGLIDRVDRDRGRFRTFLFRLTRWMLGHHLAHRGRVKRGGGAVHVPVDELELADDRAAEEDFDREWVGQLIELSLLRLARDYPQYHGPLERLLLQRESYEQIAAALGKQTTEVRNAIYRGRKKLVAYLREEINRYTTSRQDYEEELRYLQRFLPDGDGA